jgi:hypothetical protein
MHQRTSWLAVVVAAACSQLAPGARGEEAFAIRTRIYADDAKQPVATNLTIFQADTIYDFNDLHPSTVTVFDRKSRTFTLAQCEARVQTVLAASDIVRFAARQQAEAQRSDNELVRFAADPTFDESFDEDSGRLSLTSAYWDYQVTTRRLDDEWMRRSYAEFANWYTYLNSLFRPLPPGVRLKLNEVLDERRSLPQRVVVQIKRGGRVIVRQESRHELVLPLTMDEHSRVTAWQEASSGFRSVDFGTYRQSLSLTP